MTSFNLFSLQCSSLPLWFILIWISFYLLCAFILFFSYLCYCLIQALLISSYGHLMWPYCFLIMLHPHLEFAGVFPVTGLLLHIFFCLELPTTPLPANSHSFQTSIQYQFRKEAFLSPALPQSKLSCFPSLKEHCFLPASPLSHFAMIYLCIIN